MATPSTLPTWATDANFSSGPKNGSPTKVTPSAGALAQGDVPGQPYRSERKNWVLYWLCRWAEYVSDLNTETGFVNAAFDWGGIHNFNLSANFNSNTTLNGTTLSADDITLTSPISRIKMWPLDSGTPCSPTATQWLQEENGEWFAENPGELLHFAISLPSGSIVTRVRVGYSAVNANPDIALRTIVRDRTLPFGGPTVTNSWLAGALPSGDQIVDSGTISVTAGDLSELSLQIQSSPGAYGTGPRDYLRWIEITYSQVRVGERV